MSREMDLLKKAVDYVNEHPEEHNQWTWGMHSLSCGTVGCIAFHICRIAGCEITWKFRSRAVCNSDPRADGVHVRNKAIQLLGIMDSQGDYLFSGRNCREDIKRIATTIAMARGEMLWPENTEVQS